MTKTLSDTHGKRANRSAGARPARDFVDADGQPKRRVPGDLDPATFAHRVGVEADQSDPAIEAAHRAFNGMHRVLTDLHKRERAIRADRSKTPENHQMRVAQVVDKNFDTPVASLDGARKRLNAEIDGINDEIADSFRSKMDREDAKELRKIVRDMTREKRRKYLADVMKAGNFAPVAAILAHPEAVVSGMSETERADLRSRYERALHGESIARRERLTRAVEQLENGWITYMDAAMQLRDERADDIAAAAQAADDAVNRAIDLDGD